CPREPRVPGRVPGRSSCASGCSVFQDSWASVRHARTPRFTEVREPRAPLKPQTVVPYALLDWIPRGEVYKGYHARDGFEKIKARKGDAPGSALATLEEWPWVA